MTRSEDVGASVVGSDEQSAARGGQGNAAATLLKLARESYDLGRSDSGAPFAVPKGGARIACFIRGSNTSLRARLAREYFRKTGRVAPNQALSEAMVTLEGFALEQEPTRLHLRVAEHDGSLYFDLGSEGGEAVRIRPGEWSIVSQPPVLFTRTELTGVVPMPQRGGRIEELWEWVNVAEEDRALVVAFLVSAFWPDVAHVILGIFGQQGSGKTTFMRALVELVDPSPVPVRKPPRDNDSWVTAASGSWMVGLDNVSTVSEAMSDTLCRASTGEGDVRRRLYTDGELHVFSFRRVVLMTGIDLGSLPGDLADRLLPITLDVIDDDQRREEARMWPAFLDARPRLLGALLDVVADVMRVMPQLELDRLPRMADFARVLHAVDHVLGTDGLRRYRAAQGSLAADTLSGDSFITCVMEAIKSPFCGTSKELLSEVTPTDDSWGKPRDWPTNGRVVTQRLQRQAPAMRRAGWTVTNDGGRNHAKALRWSIDPPDLERMVGEPPQSPQHPPDQARRPQRHDGEHWLGDQSRGDSGNGACDPSLIPARQGHPETAEERSM